MSTNLGGASCFGFGLTQMQPAAVRLRLPPARAADTSSSQSPARLTAVLEQVDQLLSQGNDMAALSLVRSTQGGDGGLRAFGAARQVPQRLYKLDELKLNGIDTSAFLSPVDLTLGSIERNLQIAAVLGGFSVSAALELSQLQILFLILGLLSLWSVDFVYFGGGVRNLVLDTIGHYLSQKYHNRVIQHEAGHFLIAYLLGVLPKGYTITSLDTLMNQGSLNVQAGAAFVDYEFLEEMVNKFSCIALAGVAAEYLLYGRAEGGLADINKLDGLLKGLGFTQKKADSQVRWAVLNTVLILRRHEKARSQLAEAMSTGKSVGSCIQVIEECISTDDI
ncbi:stress regulated protein isoform X1 [Zea mays]|uniref:stress regulated protein isoform X1 n=1 Tax=Zea mays TaxID=4577 RepID=UPI0004DEBEC7|nr:stress regulated protein isoform X1 [Zea mays]|eukprot:XP_008672985.1 stress regulated protein isoform X1 [Zea mays]